MLKVEQNKNSKQQTSGINQATKVALDDTTLKSLARNDTLEAIGKTIDNILQQLNGGIKITTDNVVVDTDKVNIPVGGQGAGVVQSSGATGELVRSSGVFSSSKRKIVGYTDVYRSEDKVSETKEIHRWVKASKDDVGKLEHTSTVFTTNVEAYKKLLENFISAAQKQKVLESQIANAKGPTSELQVELQTQNDIVTSLEKQLCEFPILRNTDLKM